MVPLDKDFYVRSQYNSLDNIGDPSVKPPNLGGNDVVIDEFVDKEIMMIHCNEGFKQGDLVMVWNKAYKYMTQHTQALWIFPFSITFSLDKDMVFLTSNNGTQIAIYVHLDNIEPYFPDIT